MDNTSTVSVIREELKRRKMTYKELSEISGVPIDTLNNFFRGKTKNPRIDTMQAIERALGIENHSPLEWTDADRALGVGNHKIILSEDDWEWLELKSETLRKKGNDYYEMLKRMIKAAIEIK